MYENRSDKWLSMQHLLLEQRLAALQREMERRERAKLERYYCDHPEERYGIYDISD